MPVSIYVDIDDSEDTKTVDDEKKTSKIANIIQTDPGMKEEVIANSKEIGQKKQKKSKDYKDEKRKMLQDHEKSTGNKTLISRLHDCCLY